MARYQVILAYDGTHFQGYQRQANARTVQGATESALKVLGWTGRTVLSAGRTDTGVHASGQVIAFDLEWTHGALALRDALNANLPEDVSALEVRPAPAEFHPRYAAIFRRYRYRIYTAEVRDPLRERYAWQVRPEPDPTILEEAARPFAGSHDFAAFGTPPRPNGATVRTVHRSVWQHMGDELIYEVEGNAFLYHMVRRLVYLQVQAGQGRLSLRELADALEKPAPLIPGLAPPCGLTLVEVGYPFEALMENQTNLAEGLLHNTLAASGEDNRGQDLRP